MCILYYCLCCFYAFMLKVIIILPVVLVCQFDRAVPAEHQVLGVFRDA